MPEQIGYFGFNNYRQLAHNEVKSGLDEVGDCEKNYLFLLHFFHN